MIIEKLCRNIDRDLARFGLLFSSLLTVYLGVYKETVLYLIPGIFSFISCAIWLAIRNDVFLSAKSEERSSGYLISSLFFLALSFAILSFNFRPYIYERPPVFFLALTSMAGLIVLQILFLPKILRFFIIFQITVLGLIIAWSQMIPYTLLIGVDPWYHQMIVSKITTNGFIPEDMVYSKIPFFHSFVSLTSLVIDQEYKLAAMCSASLMHIVLISLYVYLIGNLIFRDYRIGLFGSLLAMVANYSIQMSYTPIPNSIGLVLILMLFYLLLLNSYKKLDLRILGLILFLIFPIILTHTLSSVFVVFLLLISIIGFVFYNKIYPEISIDARGLASVYLLILFTVSMLFWWTYASGHIGTLGKLISWGFSMDSFIQGPSLRAYIPPTPLFEKIFDSIGMFLFFSISFIGIFYAISRRGNFYNFITSIIGFSALSLGFFSIVSGHSIVDERWWYFAEIFLSIPLAVAVILVGSKLGPFNHVFQSLFVSILALLLIVCPAANNDSKTALTLSELKAIKTISIINEDEIYTDTYTASSQNWIYGFRFMDFSLNLLNKNFNNISTERFLLIRTSIVKRSFKLMNIPYKLDYDPRNEFSKLAFSKLYDNGFASGFMNMVL